MTPCIEWTGPKTREGYGRFRWQGHDKQREMMAHRAVYQFRYGPISRDMLVMHACDNPPCVNIEHLSVGTPQDNMTDKVVKGRQPRGERHGGSKLTEDQVREIYASTESGVALASKYGVSDPLIGFIRRGLIWKHVTTHQGEN